LQRPDAISAAQLRDFDRRLEVFKAHVDLRACEPSADSPYWLSEISRLSRDDFGVLALLGPTGVCVAHGESEKIRPTTRFVPDPPLIALLGLVSAVRDEGLTLAVASPPIGRHLPLLIVAATALAQTVKRKRDGEAADGRGILVVSTDLDVRSRYCDLYVGNQQIEEVHPGSRLRPGGDRVALTAGRDLAAAEGVCFYLPRGSLPTSLNFRPALILLDFRYARTNPLRTEELIAWIGRVRDTAGVVALYSCGDVETAERLSKAEFSGFSLDHQAIATASDCVRVPTPTSDVGGLELRISAAPPFLEREHRLLEMSEAEQVEELFANIGNLLDEHGQTHSRDLNRARWLFATLRQLPVPISWYEQSAYNAGRRTLRNLINNIGVLSRYDRVGAVLQSLRMQFDLLYRELDRANPRAHALQRELPSIADAPERTLLLVRDRSIQRAVRTWIDLEAFRGAEWVPRVDVLACPEFASNPYTRYSRALICGAFPRRHRWIVGAALAEVTYFSTYPHETDLVEHQLRGFYSPEILERTSRQRSQTVARITGANPIASHLGQESTPAKLRLHRPAKKKAFVPRSSSPKSGGLNDLARLVAEAEKRSADVAALNIRELETSWRSNDCDVEEPEEIAAFFEEGEADEVYAYKLGVRSSIRGQGYIWIRRDQVVECVSQNRPNDLTVLLPTELEPGDVILQMETGGRTDLFDRIVEVAENQPQLAYLSRFRREWRDAVERVALMHRRHGTVDYSGILAKLQSYGATIQSWLTVRNWVENYVIGPEDLKSIVALGRLAEVDTLARNATDFDRAFRRIRGIRQGIGRRLNTTIRQQFKNFASGDTTSEEDTGQALDSRLGLPLDELLETVEYLQVLSVSDSPQMLSVSALRQFIRE
jgi:hypothetical protein